MTTCHELSVVDFFLDRIAVASPQWENSLTRMWNMKKLHRLAHDYDYDIVRMGIDRRLNTARNYIIRIHWLHLSLQRQENNEKNKELINGIIHFNTTVLIDQQQILIESSGKKRWWRRNQMSRIQTEHVELNHTCTFVSDSLFYIDPTF
jgi:hypothetical protein